MIESLKINNKKVQIIDQTLLPTQEKYIEINDYKKMIEAVKKLRIRGAPAIGIAGLLACAMALNEYKEDLQWYQKTKQAFTEIESARPTAVNLSYAVNIAEKIIDNPNFDPSDEILWTKAIDLAKEEKSASEAMAKNGADLIYNGQAQLKILTHCNTGSLATYGQGTALSVIKALALKTKVIVWVDETRPLLQGARLTMWELIKEGIECYLITDSMAAHTIKMKGIDLIITGADRITSKGDSANKIGSLGLSILAKHYNIPFYIVAPSSTIDYTIASGEKIVIEERPGEEIRKIKDIDIAPSGCQVYNPAFDVVDNRNIRNIITERGVFSHPYNFVLD